MTHLRRAPGALLAFVLMLLLAPPAGAANFASSNDFWGEFGATALYAVLGIVLAIFGYFIFDKLAPFSVTKELTEDDNLAMGVVVGAMVLGVSIIIAAAIA